MISGWRYLMLTAARTRAPLLPMTAAILAVAGTFYQPLNEVGASWAVMALFAAGITGWLVVAVLSAEPVSQADMATAACGGMTARVGMTASFVCVLAMGLAVLFVAYPLILDVLVSAAVFERPVQLGDIGAALVVIAACAAVGGAIGVLCSPPRIVRRASSAAAVLALLLVLLVVAGPLGDVGGPLAAAEALDRAAAGDITAAELIACGSCALLFAMLLLASAALDRRRG